MDETPKTDAEVMRRNYGHDMIPADFARTLERELTALRAENAQLRERLEDCGKMVLGEHDAHRECHAKAEAAEARLREGEKDAERYRWLRDSARRYYVADGGRDWRHVFGDELDAAIDAALSKPSPPSTAGVV